MALLDKDVQWNPIIENYTYESIEDFLNIYNSIVPNYDNYILKDLKDIIREENSKGYNLLLYGKRENVIDRLQTHFFRLLI